MWAGKFCWYRSLRCWATRGTAARPSFIAAARPEAAEPLLVKMQEILENRGLHVETGRFRTHMEVELVNDGPVTILIDSRKVF